MGTRSITHIHEMKSLDDEESIVCSFYRHWDGYPEGHGMDLAMWLHGKRLVNGINANHVKGRDFNRAGTMAVPLMAYIQEQSGCEVIPTGSADLWEDYTYDVYFRDGMFVIGVTPAHGDKVEIVIDDPAEFVSRATEAEDQEDDEAA